MRGLRIGTTLVAPSEPPLPSMGRMACMMRGHKFLVGFGTSCGTAETGAGMLRHRLRC